MPTWLADDLRRAFRTVRRAPGLSLTVAVVLSLTIGATTAAFSLVNAIVLRALPVRAPDALVLLQATDARGVQNRPIYRSTFAELAKLPVFDRLALFSGGALFLAEVRGARFDAAMEASSPGFLEMLGVQPQLGRFLADEDDRPGAPGVVVVSDEFWRQAFSGDRAAIGETVIVDGHPATVIGVTPPGYPGIYADSGFDIAISMTFLTSISSPDPKRPVRGLNVAGRLAGGVSIDRARAALDAAWPAIRSGSIPAGIPATEMKEAPTQLMRIESLAGGISSLKRQYRDPLLVTLTMAATLLFIGCVNLSGLLLARTAARDRDIAIALAIGGSRRRLSRELIVEMLLPATVGAVAGLAIAWWLTTAAGPLLWRGTSPLSRSLTPDFQVFVFVAAITLLVAASIAVLPAWAASRTRTAELLRSGRAVLPAHRASTRALLVVQTALSLILLAGAGLLGSSLVNLRRIALGVQTDGLRFTRFVAVPGGYQNLDAATYYPELVRQLEAIPSMQSVALATTFPSFYGLDIAPALYAASSAGGGDSVDALMERVTPGFFTTVGVPLIAGRDFTWADDAAHPAVAVINDSLRRRLFGDVNPVGQRMRIGSTPAAPAVEIVGVVADAAMIRYKEPHAPQIFRPRMQELALARAPLVLFRANGPTESIDAAISDVAARLGHEYSRGFRSVNEQIDLALVRERLLATLGWSVASLAALLSSVGIYSALAFAVVRRRREIGIRLAIGASASAIRRAIMREGLTVTSAGIALGVAGALASGRAISSWLFGVSASEPVVLAMASACFLIVGVAAGLGPAVRAARVDPVEALRAD
jgi:predicted permease